VIEFNIDIMPTIQLIAPIAKQTIKAKVGQVFLFFVRRQSFIIFNISSIRCGSGVVNLGGTHACRLSVVISAQAEI
jgi:hypothetical protein